MDQRLWHEEHCGRVAEVSEVLPVPAPYNLQQFQPVTLGSPFREIGQKCPQELARDTSGAKGYTAFLAELAEQTPAIVLANMSVLLHHLDGEVLFLECNTHTKYYLDGFGFV